MEEDVFYDDDYSSYNDDDYDDINIKEIFGNPIYERLIGSYGSINQIFDGKFNLVISDLKQTFGKRAIA